VRSTVPTAARSRAALVNYGALDTARILRKPHAEIEAILGYIAEARPHHRDNLVVPVGAIRQLPCVLSGASAPRGDEYSAMPRGISGGHD